MWELVSALGMQYAAFGFSDQMPEKLKWPPMPIKVKAMKHESTFDNFTTLSKSFLMMFILVYWLFDRYEDLIFNIEYRKTNESRYTHTYF